MSADKTIAEGRKTDPAASSDITTESQIAEQERQFREVLELCPAALVVVDEDGRLLFHNARLRELLGYREDEMELIDTHRFWRDPDQRSRIVDTLCPSSKILGRCRA